MNRHRRIRLCVALTAVAALAGCGGARPPSSADAASISSALARLTHAAAGLTASVSAQPPGSPTGKIRVINLYSTEGQPGGPVDLFDVLHPTASDVPIIKDLAYGQVSPYVSPRAGDPNGPSQLWIYPAGSLQPSGAYTGGNLSNAGWTADQQLTVVLEPTSMTGSFGGKEISDAPSAEPAAATRERAGR